MEDGHPLASIGTKDTEYALVDYMEIKQHVNLTHLSHVIIMASQGHTKNAKNINLLPIVKANAPTRSIR